MIQIMKGDITRLEHTDAIVNAANSSLLGGGGVDGAIHRAAGPELLHECRKLNGCRTGEARITKGYRLPCRYVIHTVGPVWQGGKRGEAELLKNCYLHSLELAVKNGVSSIAFPAVSTGVYGYPKEQAAIIAVHTVQDFCEKHPGQLDCVVFVLFDEASYRIYERILNKGKEGGKSCRIIV